MGTSVASASSMAAPAWASSENLPSHDSDEARNGMASSSSQTRVKKSLPSLSFLASGVNVTSGTRPEQVRAKLMIWICERVQRVVSSTYATLDRGREREAHLVAARLGVLASEVEDVVEGVASVLALGPEVVLRLRRSYSCQLRVRVQEERQKSAPGPCRTRR